jgi:hypothetical protein
MTPIEYLEKLELFHKLVDQQRTGTPIDFAKRISISRSTLYELISEFQSRGVEIGYSRTRNTFYYKSSTVIDISFKITSLDSLSI